MFVFAHIRLPCLTFSISYENWEFIWKKQILKYESRLALRLSVNFKPLKHLQSPHLDFSFGAWKDWFSLNSFINTILLNLILKVLFYFLVISLYKRGQFWLLCSQIFAVVVTVSKSGTTSHNSFCTACISEVNSLDSDDSNLQPLHSSTT